MTKSWIAAAASIALMSGPALAQGMSDSMASPTPLAPIAAPPPVQTYSATKTMKTVDSDGVESDKSQSYTAGPDGTRATASSQTIGPDGTQISASHEEQTATPTGETSTVIRNTTTTTTTSP